MRTALRTASAALALSAALAAPALADTTNLLTNADFSQTEVTTDQFGDAQTTPVGWTYTPSEVGRYAIETGGAFIFGQTTSASDYGPYVDTLYQAVSSNIGDVYQLTFTNYNVYDYASQTVLMISGGAARFDQYYNDATSGVHTLDLVASSTTMTIIDYGYYYRVPGGIAWGSDGDSFSNVSLTDILPAAPPPPPVIAAALPVDVDEPSTLASFVLAVLGLAATRLRQPRQALA